MNKRNPFSWRLLSALITIPALLTFGCGGGGGSSTPTSTNNVIFDGMYSAPDGSTRYVTSTPTTISIDQQTYSINSNGVFTGQTIQYLRFKDGIGNPLDMTTVAGVDATTPAITPIKDQKGYYYYTINEFIPKTSPDGKTLVTSGPSTTTESAQTKYALVSTPGAVIFKAGSTYYWPGGMINGQNTISSTFYIDSITGGFVKAHQTNENGTSYANLSNIGGLTYETSDYSYGTPGYAKFTFSNDFSKLTMTIGVGGGGGFTTITLNRQ